MIARLVLLALLLVGCSGGSGGQPGSETGDVSEAVAAPSGTEGEFCGELAQQLDLLAQVPDRIAQQDPALLRQLLDDLRANGSQLLANAPPEIRQDVQTVTSATERVAATLGPDGRPTGDAVAIVTSPEVVAAGGNLQEYARTRCGLSVGQGEGE